MRTADSTSGPAIRVGDEVRVFPPRRLYAVTPDGGWPGTVTKVGRKYATATYQREPQGYGGTGERTVEFDMVTGTERGSDPRWSLTVRTPAQVEADARHEHALTVIKDAGFGTRLGHTPSRELTEAVAAAIEAHRKED